MLSYDKCGDNAFSAIYISKLKLKLFVQFNIQIHVIRGDFHLVGGCFVSRMQKKKKKKGGSVFMEYHLCAAMRIIENMS